MFACIIMLWCTCKSWYRFSPFPCWYIHLKSNPNAPQALTKHHMLYFLLLLSYFCNSFPLHLNAKMLHWCESFFQRGLKLGNIMLLYCIELFQCLLFCLQWYEWSTKWSCCNGHIQSSSDSSWKQWKQFKPQNDFVPSEFHSVEEESPGELYH